MADEESFVVVGKAQPAHAKQVSAKNRNAVLPIHLQEARDERGRKRLHGAFTGGFSAGYFNTVGSKEGWQPSTYVSSRAARSQGNSARAEDYMDEEDLRELEEARQISASSTYDASSQAAEQMKASSAAIHRDSNRQALSSIFDVLCLHTSRTTLANISDAVAGDLLKPVDESIGLKLLRKLGWREGQGVGPKNRSVNVEGRAVLLGPKESNLRKTLIGLSGTQGLGFNRSEIVPKKATASKPKTGGFGTGVLNYDDEDEDVYIEENPPNEFVPYMAESEPGKTYSKAEHTLNNVSNDMFRPAIHRVAPNGGLSSQLHGDFEAPIPPSDFAPFTRGISLSNSTTQNPNGRASLNAESRRVILGEEVLAGPSRSVFSFISPKEQNRLKEFVAKASGDSKADDFRVDPEVARAAMKGFLPFHNDPEKQSRYLQFLRYQADNTTEKPKHPPHFSEREVNAELNEFVKSAQIYRPLPQSMAARFTSSTTSAEEKTQQIQDNQVPYGRQTRTLIDFEPAPLLCKRFNIPKPKLKKPTSEQKAEDNEVLGKRAMEQLREIAMGSNNSSNQSNQNQNETEIERPSLDIFKEIFAGSDEDEIETRDETDDKSAISAKESDLVEDKDKIVFVKRSERKSAGNVKRKAIKIVDTEGQTTEQPQEDDISELEVKPAKRRPKAVDFF